MLVVPFAFSSPPQTQSPSPPPPIRNPTTHTTTHAKTDITDNDDIHDPIFRQQEKKYYDGPHHHHHHHNSCSRRDAVLILAGAAFLAAPLRPTPAVAAVAAAATAEQQQPSTSNQYNQFFFRQLQSVPTFCIVTQEGIPFHVLQKNTDTDTTNDEPSLTTHSTTTTPTTSSSSSLSAHGYFFLSYEAATQALQRLREQEPAQVQVPEHGIPNSIGATTNSASGGGVSVSSTAKIITVPLGMALQQSLSTTPSQREVMNVKINTNNHLPTHHHLVVSSEGRGDAKRIEKEFLDRGGSNNLYNNPQNYLHQNNLNNDYEKNNKNNNKKTPPPPSQWDRTENTIPLFYIEGLTVSNGKYEPRYFTQDDLLEEFTDQHPDAKLPPTQLVDLVDLYRTATLLDNEESQVNEVANNLVFVPASTETPVPVRKEVPNTSTILPNNYYNSQQIYLVDKQ